MTMVKRTVYLLTLLILLIINPIEAFSQNIPERPNPPRLVNDFAGMLSPAEVNSLEQKLDSFNDSTSTQIAIVIVPTLGQYDKADYAQRLGEKWGVGQKGKNNGILILIKPKAADSDGQIQIVTGYGVEGPIPDLTCADIIDREILPAFKNGEYYRGLDKATSTLMSLARGEFSAEQYGHKAKKSSAKSLPFGAIIIIVIIIVVISSRNSGGSNRHIGTRGLPFWMLMGMLNSGRGSSGSWGGFSGGGSGGGGGGGFGGFGGGSFGGGGAGGSW